MHQERYISTGCGGDVFDSRTTRVWFAIKRVSLAQRRVSFARHVYKYNIIKELVTASSELIIFNLFLNH